MYVSKILNVAAAVKAISTISSIFKERLGIAKAAIATINPSTRYLIILLTSSPTLISPFIIINKKKKILFAIKNLKINNELSKMERSKDKSAKKQTFERKLNNGKKNAKYVDLLEEDKPISGQKFVCVSFVSPEKILKQKEIFFFEEFLKTWEFNKSMEKFIQFINFISYKYTISFDELTNDYKDFVKEEKETLAKTSMTDDFKSFLDKNDEELEKSFQIANNFQTCTRGLKIRGSYPTIEEAELRAKMLREIDPNHDVFVGPIGMWMPWDPEAYKTGRVEYMEEELNQLMNEKTKNESNAKVAFDQRVKETKKQAIDENIKRAEKTGNVLTQNIDEQGNLIGVNNVNSQEFALKEQEEISTADICAELFEGQNIVVGNSDHGQSELLSGPFANKNKQITNLEEVD